MVDDVKVESPSAEEPRTSPPDRQTDGQTDRVAKYLVGCKALPYSVPYRYGAQKKHMSATVLPPPTDFQRRF